MSGSVTLLARKLNQFCISRPLHGFHDTALSHLPPAFLLNSGKVSKTEVLSGDLPNLAVASKSRFYELPALENARRVYTFPTLYKSSVVAPAPLLTQILEKMDPLPNIAPIEAPSRSLPTFIQLLPRLITIRRKKMKKHKRLKRYDRDFFKYQKRHREKKLRAEREFIRRMKAHLTELESFDAEKYVEETIAAAKKEWEAEFAPSGRKLYPHWSQLMSLEELYDLPKSDYIDKKAGYASEEDLKKIKELKLEYEKKFRNA
ncbi:hypothetical protein DICVIV_08293 [Dictyocaulus viviparus]|uniref:Mitochondrial mRNA-processing protein COX24 C-terminal domain-containing protein n=1 Tax=Dictyocaulus viviparus TaxID=29172 RepID=A0A0D8XPL8_DICVI|nr:hypothetical protein DICVIV_08293 [Dictyocaulus viviparus]